MPISTDHPLGEVGLAEGTWQIDPDRSELGFAARGAWGLANVRGSFGRFTGTLTVGADGTASGSLEIEAASLDTGNRKRDQHLRSVDFFGADAHPVIRFVPTAVDAHDGHLHVEGDLELPRAHTPVALTVTAEPVQSDRVRLSAETTLSRADTGMTWNRMGMLRGDVALRAHLELVR